MIDFENLDILWKSEKATFPIKYQGVMLACSGHVDSTALFHLFCQIFRGKKNFLAGLIHVNYGLRGEDSEKDQAHVENLAKSAQIPCETLVVRGSSPSDSSKSLQEWARDIRHQEFRKWSEKGFAIAVAHQADDLAENVLLRAARGSEVQNLQGMSRWDDPIWRPILHLKRADLEGYLNENGHRYRQDSTNSEFKYSRNRVRNAVLPELERVHQGAADKLVRLAKDAKSLSRFASASINSMLDERGCLPTQIAKSFDFPVFKQLISVLVENTGGSMISLSSDHIKRFYEKLVSGKLQEGEQFSLPGDYRLFVNSGVLGISADKHAHRAKLHQAKQIVEPTFKVGPRRQIVTPLLGEKAWQISNLKPTQAINIKLSIARLNQKVKARNCSKQWQIKEVVARNSDLLAKIDIIYILIADDSEFVFDGILVYGVDESGHLENINDNNFSIEPFATCSAD